MARRLGLSCDVIVYAREGQYRKQEEHENGVHYRFISIGPDKQMLRILKRFSSLRNRKRPLFASNAYYLGYILQVAKDLRREQCDLVHILNFSQFVPIIRAFNPRAKIVLNMRCEWLNQLDTAMIERRLKHVDLVIGCSEYVTEKIRKCFPQFADRCETVLNGVDVNRFVRGNGKGTGKTGKRLLFVGRVSPEKGVHVLLDAFRKVVDYHPETHLYIVGPQNPAPIEFIVRMSKDAKVLRLESFYSRNYVTQLRERIPWRVGEQVSFIGPIPHDKLMTHYQCADVFVFPSVWDEPFGVPPVEAMAMGVPVVATRTGGIAETVVEGKTGMLVEPDDADSLAEAILCLIDDDELRESMGEAGRKRAQELFTFERVMEELLIHYYNICNNSC